MRTLALLLTAAALLLAGCADNAGESTDNTNGTAGGAGELNGQFNVTDDNTSTMETTETSGTPGNTTTGS